MFFTIFTSTYNRAYTLTRLYESLCAQTEKSFEWLIIDDGSTDNTKELIKNFISEKKILIRYFKQNNSGKHIAHNRALKEAKGEFFIILDSDDYLTDNALEILLRYKEKISEQNTIVGIIALCADQNNELVGSKFPVDKIEMNYLDIYYKHNIRGDKCIVHLTDIYKQFEFPCFPEEKFMSEGLIHGRLALKYNLLCLNEILKRIEYRADGLTNSAWKIGIQNPQGLYLWNKELSYFLKQPSFILTLKIYARIIRFALWSGISFQDQLKEMNSKVYYLVAFPIGLALFMRDKALCFLKRGD